MVIRMAVIVYFIGVLVDLFGFKIGNRYYWMIKVGIKKR